MDTSKILKFIFTVLLISACVIQTEAKPISDSIIVTQEPKFDYLTWRIEAANGTWHFEIEHLETGEPSTGFSQLLTGREITG